MGARKMRFLLRHGWNGFVSGIPSGSTVYAVAFTEPKDAQIGVLLLTSDAGIHDGTIHCVRLGVKLNGTDALNTAIKAEEIIEQGFQKRGIRLEIGSLLEAGLNEAARYFGNSGPYTLEELEQWAIAGDSTK